MKGIDDEKQEKSTTRSVANEDGDGQGKLYSPEFAVKIKPRQQQHAHVFLPIPYLCCSFVYVWLIYIFDATIFNPKQEIGDEGHKNTNNEASSSKEEKPAPTTLPSKL
ncbi:hypothetical protein AgCh_034252 [Apium graveolens]